MTYTYIVRTNENRLFQVQAVSFQAACNRVKAEGHVAKHAWHKEFTASASPKTLGRIEREDYTVLA